MKFENSQRLIAAAVAMALMGPGVVLAQEAALEEVQVTGSRIVQAPGMFTPTPVTSVTADTLKEMSPGALSDALAQLPQFFGNTTPQSMLGGQNSGGSNVNLRGAGINRTLVLLDGRRVVSSNRFGTVDVNVFPDMLLKGIETVTGGASAAMAPTPWPAWSTSCWTPSSKASRSTPRPVRPAATTAATTTWASPSVTCSATS